MNYNNKRNFTSTHNSIKKYKKASPTVTPILKDQTKMLNSIRDAIVISGLTDGMTISFHHHFREGDKIINLVMDEIANLGIKDINIAPSSIANIHEPLIDHIKKGTIKSITSSGLRDNLGRAISEGILDEPVIIRSHGGRARAIETGELVIDVAFIGAPSCDSYGNINGINGSSFCGSMGYAMIDAKYADTVIAITDNLVPYPNTPISIEQTDVDFVVKIDSIGDPDGISKGATRFTKNPKELLIAQTTSDFIVNSPYFKNGFSFQTGTGGISLAVTRFLKETMIKEDIVASFGVGGITQPMTELLRDGLIKKLFDVQGFDTYASNSLKNNPNHIEMSASFYASPANKGAIINNLDICILSALEVDTNFNVNVVTGSDGIIRGASGGHCDTAACSKLSIIVAPLTRGRIPTVVDEVTTIVTPGESVDAIITEYGIAINPLNEKLINHFSDSSLPFTTIDALKQKAERIVGTPEKIEFTDKPVAIIEYRDGTIIDTINMIKE